MRLVTIEITQEDIDADGHVGNNCPAARALHRACPSLPKAHVGRDYIYPTGMEDNMLYDSADKVKSPPDLQKWISDYDRSIDDDERIVEPATFQVELPCD